MISIHSNPNLDKILLIQSAAGRYFRISDTKGLRSTMHIYCLANWWNLQLNNSCKFSISLVLHLLFCQLWNSSLGLRPSHRTWSVVSTTPEYIITFCWKYKRNSQKMISSGFYTKWDLLLPVKINCHSLLNFNKKRSVDGWIWFLMVYCFIWLSFWLESRSMYTTYNLWHSEVVSWHTRYI